jgi:glycosyltransferase involved in cell wall biosynthesis
MKILQVGTGSIRIPPENYGGIELYIFETSRELAHSGNDVTIFDMEEQNIDPATDSAKPIGYIRVPVTKQPTKSGSFLMQYLRSKLPLVRFAMKTGKHIQRTRYDVIHLHVTIIGLVLAITKPGQRKRMVYTVHSPIWAMEKPGILDRLYIRMDCVLMRRVGHVIVQSEYARKRVQATARIPQSKISVVPCGVDTGIYHPAEAQPLILKKYGSEGQKVILFAGRIAPYKGIKYLVDAADIVVNRMGHKEALFLLVGPLQQYGIVETEHTQYIEKLKADIKYCRLEEYVKLAGEIPREDLIALFQSCDIFVLPSLAESSPAVTLQAMSCARTVVATAAGGVPEQINDGHNGFIVPPADDVALAQKIERLLENPAECMRMGQNGRQLAEEHFGWNRVSSKIAGIYRLNAD